MPPATSRHLTMTAAICLSAALLAGCSSSSQQHNGGVIIDTQGVDMAAYYTDLDDCKHYAEQVNAGEKVISSGAGGAVLGGVLGAVVGNSTTAAKGAGVGAVTGGAKGYSESEREKQRVIRNCLKGRGYRVLN